MIQLQQAFLQKAQIDAEAPLKAVATLQSELVTYAAAVKKNAEVSALATMLAAVGQGGPTPPDMAPIQATLRTSLLAVLELIGGVPPFVSTTEPVPEPPVASDLVAVEADDAVAKEEVADVLSRAEALSGDRWKEVPTPRLIPLLQGITAEIRFWQGQLPTVSPEHWKLGQAIKMLTAIRGSANFPDFIKGLSLQHTGDWLRIAAEAYARVARFDRDTEVSLIRKATPSVPRSKDDKDGSGVTHTWPEYTYLRATLAHSPLLLIGGLPVPSKISLIQARFGLEVEWLHVYRDTGLGAAVARVRSGTAGAVILLEKFMGHSACNALIGAITAHGIPWAYGGDGGVAKLGRAFEQLDTHIAA